MGNLCGKEASDPFDRPGRTLGAAPPAGSSSGGGGVARLPRQKPNYNSTTTNTTSGGRLIGGSGGGGGGGGGHRDRYRDDEALDARAAAARAAEERAKASKPSGKLGKDLAAQRQRTQAETLEQASREERLRRDADAGAVVRNWD